MTEQCCCIFCGLFLDAFLNRVPQNPRVPRKVARGSARDHEKNIYKYRVLVFTLVCVYVNNDH
jgi:hypothetical protein